MRVKISKLSIFIFILNIAFIVVLGIFISKKLNLPRPINLPVYDEEVQVNPLLAKDGSISSFHTEAPKKGLLIYISDAQDDAVIEQARKFAKLSYYVVLIDAASTNQLLENDSSECKNFSLYFKNLTHELKTHWQLDAPASSQMAPSQTVPSLMIGQQQGAALSYIALAQTHSKDYHAVLSLNFEPRINTSVKPLCEIPDASVENSVQMLPPISQLASSWYVFQEQEINEKFDALKFTDKIPNARLTLVSGANARGEKNTSVTMGTQILQWLDPRLTDQLHASSGKSDLPLIEVPVPKDVPAHPGSLIAFIITGDGGWAEIDKNLAKHLSQKGIPTVALDSLSYFWKYRSPEETTQAVESTIKHYLTRWHKDRALLIGYSFGADLIPVIANKFSAHTQKEIALIALLGLGKSASFEFRLSSWLNADDNPNRIALPPELQKLKWIQPLCVYGLKDKLTQCPTYEAEGIKLIGLPGNHHFDKKYEDVVDKLLENIH